MVGQGHKLVDEVRFVHIASQGTQLLVSRKVTSASSYVVVNME